MRPERAIQILRDRPNTDASQEEEDEADEIGALAITFVEARCSLGAHRKKRFGECPRCVAVSAWIRATKADGSAPHSRGLVEQN